MKERRNGGAKSLLSVKFENGHLFRFPTLAPNMSVTARSGPAGRNQALPLLRTLPDAAAQPPK